MARKLQRKISVQETKPSTYNIMTNRLRGSMVRGRGVMRKFQRKGSKNAKI